MENMQKLNKAVVVADASLKDLVNPDPDIRMNAILDVAELLTAAKAVVLDNELSGD
jgi:hypothetical protein